MSEGQRSDWSCRAILPPEIIEDVLSRLPVKSLCRFKCVSHSWKSLISSPQFSKTHLNRTNTNNPKHLDRNIILIYRSHNIYSLDLTADVPPIATSIDFPLLQQCENRFVKVENSCNGLVLVSGFLREGNSNLFLLNPSTRQCKRLPRLPFVLNPYSEYVYGVGYDSSKDDYKVVMLWSPKVESGPESGSSTLSDVTIVAVYSLENDAWRRLQGPRYIIDGFSHGVYCNGHLHWVCWWDGSYMLVAFDLADEIFSEVPLPASFDDYEILYLEVVIVGGYLCLGHVSGPEPIEFWMMKEYGDRESWAKILIAKHGMNLSGLVEDNEYLLMATPEYLFIVYNPEIGVLRDIVAPVPNAMFSMGTYVESLISPIR